MGAFFICSAFDNLFLRRLFIRNRLRTAADHSLMNTAVEGMQEL
jgi:hypothetical protein